ncbi:TPA: RepA leader peptide Tap [Klebsiella pneumoniae]
MWLMKTLLTSRCINQRGAGHGNSQPFKVQCQIKSRLIQYMLRKLQAQFLCHLLLPCNISAVGCD